MNSKIRLRTLAILFFIECSGSKRIEASDDSGDGLDVENAAGGGSGLRSDRGSEFESGEDSSDGSEDAGAPPSSSRSYEGEVITIST
ncbi:hypothetical protein [Rhodopirellula europaea]|uniref:Uncharacterized protein n=1 Tax=Rhodopirellula europaea 6C TaxID=1263867 RepID=M2B468_9BACT|nr:hypothetical protein [Rhodopirellula europaea]EMB16533.1 hypothetical protein RE6C_02898 [Rhodopirellula europaea 6C]